MPVIEADILRGQWKDPDAGKITLTEYAWPWLRERNLAATSRDRNEVAIRVHILPTLGNLALNEITTPRVHRWRAELLEAGAGEPTVARAYQVVRAIMNTAVDDGLIQRNPCRIKGAGTAKTPERPTLTVAEVFAVADAIEPRTAPSFSWRPSRASGSVSWRRLSGETSTWHVGSCTCRGRRWRLSRPAWR